MVIEGTGRLNGSYRLRECTIPYRRRMSVSGI